jgi:hypothetical protein
MKIMSFLIKAEEEWKNGNMTEAVIHLHSKRTWESWFHYALGFCHAFCFVKGRIKWVPASIGFEEDLGEIGFDVKSIPPYDDHGSLLAYLGPNIKRFAEVFSEFGSVLQKAPGMSALCCGVEQGKK